MPHAEHLMLKDETQVSHTTWPHEIMIGRLSRLLNGSMQAEQLSEVMVIMSVQEVLGLTVEMIVIINIG